VYGYFDNLQIYRFEINPEDMTEIITIEAIDLPKISVANNRMITGIDIANNRMIDVGLYQLAVYSGA
jgi:hypothetical protein